MLIIYRVEARVRPTRTGRARDLFTDLVRASRHLPGVVAFDILEDRDQPGRFVSIEVYTDQAAVDRQGTLPQLAAVMAALPDLLTVGLAGTRYDVAATRPWPGATTTTA